MGLVATLKSIKPAFWIANVQEAGERLAYFGIRAVLPLMMVSEVGGGLGLNMSDKGIIFGFWALIQCLVPMFSGGFSENFGYKKSIIVAFIINLLGYLLMANICNIAELFAGSGLHPTLNFWLMMLAGITIGLGTAIFKPPVGGVVAKSLNKKNSGFGFGLFYWVVNIGGFLAPMAATALRGSEDAPTWSNVFYGAAIVTVINIIFTLFCFKEPSHEVEADGENSENADEQDGKLSDENPDDETAAPKEQKSAWKVFSETMGVLWNDKKMLIFLLIVSGFWLMFMQLWDLLPNFLEEWVDRRAVGGFLVSIADALKPVLGLGWLGNLIESWTDNGAIKPEMVINIDAAAIILLVLPFSALFARFKMMTALVIGMVISVIGFVFSGMTMNCGWVCLAVFIFAIGEIICSPKFDEYVGMTAPADKKAIYMGFVNMPFAIGWAFGNFLSGPLYDLMSSKQVLASQYLVSKGVAAETLENLDQNALMAKVQEISGSVDVFAANEVLWDAYQPWMIWIVLGGLGAASMIGMIAFYLTSGMSKNENESDQNKSSEDGDDKDSENVPSAAVESEG